MKVRCRFYWLIAFVVMGYSFFSTAAASSTCDRACLKEFLTKYVDAMLAHKTDLVPLADNVRMTEDCKEINVGEGFFKDAAGTVSYRLDILDVRLQSAFAFVVLKSSTSSVMFGVRLKIAEGKISQIETMVVKNQDEGMIFTPANLKTGTPVDSEMTKMPATADLNTREEAIAMAVKYPLGLKKGGTFEGNGVPFTATARRLENGQLMAGPGCTFLSGCEDIRKQGLPTLPKMVHKVALVDEQAGIVLLRMNFGAGSVMGGGTAVLDVFESFKVYNDSMHAVLAFMQKVPDGTAFGWDYDAITQVTASCASRRNNSMLGCTVTRSGITMQLPTAADKVAVDLFDISGKVVYSSVFTKIVDNRLVLSSLQHNLQGCFIGRVTSNSAISGVQRLEFKVVLGD